ncbi:hypothetical protein V8E54_013474 [Elaphomyces granulatus]
MASLPPLSDISILSSVVEDPSSFAEIVQRTEEILRSYVPISNNDSTSKILHGFLEFLPKAGRIRLMEDIISAPLQLKDLGQYLLGFLFRMDLEDIIIAPLQLKDLGQYLLGNILVPLRASGGKTCDPPIQALFMNKKSFFADELARDGFRCVISGIWDRHYRQPGERFGPTNCAHIILLSLGDFGGGASRSHLDCSNPIFYFPEIKGTNISLADMNVIENAMTTMTSLQSRDYISLAAFGRFNFSLDELEGEKDTYRITTYGDFMSSTSIDALLMPPNFCVKFSTPDMYKAVAQAESCGATHPHMCRQSPSQDRYC